jgi:hypothetical protein
VVVVVGSHVHETGGREQIVVKSLKLSGCGSVLATPCENAMGDIV